MNIPRVIIAGTQSGVGKTTISIGLMGALKDAGYRVQGFKVGPDYIDPSYHNIITNRLSENLDVWLAPKRRIVEIFTSAIEGADFAVIEGVMGLYDGVSGTDETGSTAQIAKLLNCPVILVIDVYHMVRTAAAVVLGFKNFDKRVKIRGVILNNVAGEAHAKWCRDAIEAATGLPVVGWLPVNKKMKLSERHLGLIPTPEKDSIKGFLPEIKSFVRTNVNVNQVVEIAKSAEPLKAKISMSPKNSNKCNLSIGLAFDEAFNFYYPTNLRLLERNGYEIKRFSPVHDKAIPDNLDGIYIGGGFPEMFLKELEANRSMKQSILEAAHKDMPIYAECAGLMYLTKSVTDFDGRCYEMVGALPGKTVMTNSTLVTYSLAEVAKPNIISTPGANIKGHEFHNSVILDIPEDAEFAYKMLMGEGIKGKKDGWIKNRVLASYTHIHFAQNPNIVRHFARNSKLFSKTKIK